MIERTVSYSEEMVRAAAWKGAWQRIGWRMVAAIALVLAGLIPGLRRGERSWWIGAGGTILLFAVLFIAAVVMQQIARSSRRFRAMRDGRAQVRLTEDVFRFSSEAGAVEYPWTRLRYVQRFDEYWLVGTSHREWFLLSRDGLGPEAEAFIISCIERGLTPS